MEKEILAAGDSTELEIIFSTKKSRSRVRKRPKIQTNEGPPDKYVEIKSNIVTRPDSTYPIIVQPYKLDLSQTTEKVIDKIEFAIRNVSDEELKIELVSWARDYFEIDLPKSIKAGDSKKGKLTLLKSVIEKSFEKSFTIQLSDKGGSRFTIPVKRAYGAGKTARPTTSGR